MIHVYRITFLFHKFNNNKDNNVAEIILTKSIFYLNNYVRNAITKYRIIMYMHNAITKYHPPSDKIKNYEHKFNTNNEIWPELTKFLPELSTQIEHKLNTDFNMICSCLYV